MNITNKHLAELTKIFNETLAKKRNGKEVNRFVKSQIVSTFRKYPEELYELEDYKLPEITCLICHSSSGLLRDKAEKYSSVKPLYSRDDEKTIKQCVSLSLLDFKEHILPYIDKYAINTILKYVSEKESDLDKKKNLRNNKSQEIKQLNDKIVNYEKNLKKLTSKLNRLVDNNKSEGSLNKKKDISVVNKTSELDQKDLSVDSIGLKDESIIDYKLVAREQNLENDEKFPDNNKGKAAINIQESGLNSDCKDEQPENNIAELKSQINNIQKKINTCSEEKTNLEKEQSERQHVIDEGLKLLELIGPNIDLIKRDAVHYDDNLHIKRSRCFEYLNEDNYSNEKKLIKKLLSEEEIEQFYIDGKTRGISVDNIIKVLKDDCCITKEIDVIYLLIQKGLIDLDDKNVREYLDDNTDILLYYLINNFNGTYEQLCDDKTFRILFDYAVIHDLSDDKYSFRELWNHIYETDVWNYIMNTVGDENNLVRYAGGLKGRALRSFKKCLDASDIMISDFVLAMKKQKIINQELLILIIQKYDQDLRRKNKELRRANRLIVRQEEDSAARAFSAMYGPMDRIETLVFDLKRHNGIIKQETIIEQLSECIGKFREGLEALDVSSMESFETWKSQKSIDYNNKIHRYETGNTNRDNKVIVKTLGYRYKIADASGSGETEEKVEYATVIPFEGEN